MVFSGPMVLRLLARAKWQTRRLVWFRVADRPPALPGDRVLVREAWRGPREFDDRRPSELPAGTPIRYEADGEERGEWSRLGPWDGRYRHARFMPRALARIALAVSEVRYEQLDAITDADAIREGAYQSAGGWTLDGRTWGSTPRDAFKAGWTRIHGEWGHVGGVVSVTTWNEIEVMG